MSIKLKELIRQVRQCKTAAQERTVIGKECALIRNTMKDEKNEFRARNIAKLLFMNLLGYPTSFSQIECLKLIISPKYSDKKIGYLGLTQLFNEDSEVLMMVTNSIKMDLDESKGQFVVSLALTSLCEIATSEMCRELYSEIIKLAGSTNAFIKKKATLAAVRILRKVPEMFEEFAKVVDSLMHEKNHGVQLATFALMREILQIEPSFKTKFKKNISTAVKFHKQLLTGGYTPDYDISGINDPFLQIYILHALRLLGEGSPEASEEMYDLLTQLASNPDTGKLASNALLYEVARTIIGIEASSSLKSLGINILGKFLANRESNTKYVALAELKKVVKMDYDAVQRVKGTILDCIKDNDLPIKRGALDLLSQLINKSNIKSITKELLIILNTAEPEFLPDVAETICNAVEEYAPSPRWQVETVIKVMIIAGNAIKDEHIFTLIHVISASPDLHAFSVHSAYNALTSTEGMQAVILFTMWMIGEFGHLLFHPYSDAFSAEQVNIDEILQRIEKVLDDPKTSSKIRDYVLTTLVKLSVKLPASSLPTINSLISSQMNWPVSEVQQRSLEYMALMDGKFNSRRRELIKPVPLCKKAEGFLHGESGRQVLQGNSQEFDLSSPEKEVIKPSDSAIIFGDLLNEPVAAVEAKPEPDSTMNMLEEVFAGLGSEPAPAASSASANLFDLGLGSDSISPPSVPGNMGLLDTNFLSSSSPAAPAPVPASIPAIEGYSDSNLTIEFGIEKVSETDRKVTAYFTSKGPEISNVNLQVGVQKHLKLILLSPASDTTLSSLLGQKITQEMRISNSMVGTKPVAMKIKISYVVNGISTNNTRLVSFPLTA